MRFFLRNFGKIFYKLFMECKRALGWCETRSDTYREVSFLFGKVLKVPIAKRINKEKDRSKDIKSHSFTFGRKEKVVVLKCRII